MASRTVRTLAAVAVLVLAGCSSDSGANDPPAPTATSAPAEDPQQSYPIITRDQALATNFVRDFRRRFPDQAAGRSANEIADEGARICNFVVEKGVTREIATGRLATPSGREVGDDDYQSIVLLRMAVLGICAERAEQLAQLTG